LGLFRSREATRSASPMKAAKREEGMILTMGLRWRGVVGVVPLACSYPTASGAPVEGRAPKSGQCPNWHSVSLEGGGCRTRLEVDPTPRDAGTKKGGGCPQCLSSRCTRRTTRQPCGSWGLGSAPELAPG
jgi:hypothetical protein